MDRAGMPPGRIRPRLVVASHLVRRAMRTARDRSAGDAVRGAISDVVFFEITRRNFGWNSVIRGDHGLFPHIFMPDYDGPHFEEALRRLVFPRRGPNILYFSLTGTCPCACEYCFAGAGPLAPDLGDDAVVRVAHAVAKMRVPLVNISGGEPMTRYDRLLAAVTALNAGSEVRLFTTGFGMTDRRLDELREAGLKGLFVSLDGRDPAAFDRARGRVGAFKDAIAALKRSAAAEMLTFVNTVVGRDRFRTEGDVAAFLRFVEGIDPRIVVNFLPQLATGRGAEVDSFREPDESDAVAERIATTAARLRRPIAMLFGRVDRFMGCPGAGGKLMNVDIHGNATVCISRATLGNVLEEPFEVLHARYAEACDRLKVGFFCSDVAAHAGGELLDHDGTREALGRFRTGDDAEWQKALDRHGWLIRRLFR